ncbi:MAG: hypothetical protein E6H89_02345 [Chloroflexi bacterium]|nr:MAG: hypothetical protein E6H89_02345 [Chloroflexota bacterium]
MLDRRRTVQGLAVLGAVALATAVVVFANGGPGQTPPEPSASQQATLLSPEPTASPTVLPTREGTWTELRWSEPGSIPDNASIFDVVSWHGGYIAVGDVAGVDGHVAAAFISADGARWERTSTFSANPAIVATPTRLIALVNRPGPPQAVEAWVSLDGRSWQRDENLALSGASLGRLAAHARTIVAIGTDAAGRSAMWRSVDSAAWSPIQQPSTRAIVRRVAAVGDGFVAIGRDGEPDVARGGVGARGVGRPAAWWSADGGAWNVLQVQGVEAEGAELSDIFDVTDGYFAIGSDTTTPGQNPRSPLLWYSADGRDWRMIGPPAHWGRVSANGRQAVIFAAADFGTVALGAWTSQDGRGWNQLSFSGDVAEMPAFETAVGQSSRIESIFAEPTGVIVIGQQNGHITAWFAQALVR